MADIARIETRVLDELSLDIYAPHHERHLLIPPDVLREIVMACVTAFVLGFCGLQGLGEGARAKLLGLLATFKSGGNLAPTSDAQTYTDLLTEARRQLATGALSARVERAERELFEALRGYGMHDKVAAAHAKRLTAILTEELGSGTSTPES